MKVLYLVTGLGVGGAEKVVVGLADAMKLKGYDVLLVSLTGESKILPKNSAIEVVNLSMRSSLDFLKALKKLGKIIENFNPDIIHSHMYHANVLARIAHLFHKRPKLICTAHSANEGGIIRSLIYRSTNFLSDVFTNVSQEAVDAFIAKKIVKKGQMISVPNGINLNDFYKDLSSRAKYRNDLQINDDEFVFLAIGRLDQSKDYPNLLNAFASLTKTNLKVRLLIVGDGILKDSLLELTKELKLSDKVTFLGLRSDINSLLNSTDAFVLSSAWEGFSLVVLEAMLCEVCVVATDSGGPNEVLGGLGVLVPIKDSEALMKGMLKISMMSSEERKEMGKLLCERAHELFSIDAIIDRWIEIYFG